MARPTSNAPTSSRNMPTGGSGKVIKSSPMRHSESISTKRVNKPKGE